MARLQDKRTFKGINFDDADEFLEDGDTRNMLNVRVNYSESGDDGIITNVKGTVSLFAELSFSLPSGTNKCIATCPDDQNNRLIWLNYNSNGNHGIYCYNTDTNTIQTVLASSTLNFTNAIIHSIDILDGNLAWVDENRPRAINVDDGIAGVYGGAPIEDLINDAKVVPMFPPECTTTVTFGDDYIKSLKSFQFTYHYVFKNGEKGAWSTVSKLVSTGYRDERINKITLDASNCELFTKASLSNVIDYVEFASRELYTFNFNQFLRIPTADFISAGGIIDYYDTESKTPVDIADTNIPFYENPIKAGTVAFQNDRKFYADCTEGYDAFSLTLSGVNTQVIPASGGIPYLSDCDTHVGDRYLKPDSEYNYSIEFHDKYGRKSGAIDLPELVIKTQEQLSNDYKANVLQFGLNLASVGSYPSWAEKFEIVRSDNKTVTFFVQGRVNTVLYCTGYDSNDDPTYINATANVASPNITDNNAIEIHIDISNWVMYGTNIGYTFTEGDRVTFLTMGGVLDSSGARVLKGLKIKELRGSLLIVDYPEIGRTNLNHAMLASTTWLSPEPPFPALYDEYGYLSRFIVGDNGVVLYSRFAQVIKVRQGGTGTVTSDTPLAFPFSYSGIAEPAKLPSISNHLYGVSLIWTGTAGVSSIDIFIVGSEGFFIRGNFNPLTDTFGTWNTANSGATTDLNSIESNFGYPSRTDLVIVGDNGVILNYNISTGVFTQRTSGTTENLNYVYRNQNSNTLIAVGDNGTILRTTDNGVTWAKITITNCQNLNGAFINGVYATVVGDEGLVLFSTDTGATWTQRGISTAVNLNSVEGQGNSSNTVYIAGDNGYLSQFDMTNGNLINGFVTGTTKDINFFQSYFVPVTPDKGILVGDLDLIMDADINVAPAVFTLYSSNIVSLYGAIYLNYKAKIEVFSPKTVAGPVIYYETGDAHAVGANYTFNKGKENDGDVFLITKDFRGTDWAMAGDIIFSMTPNSLDTAGTWDKDLGRPNTVLLYPEKQERRNIVRFSERYVQDSKINGLSNFTSLNYEPIPNEFGIVRKITPLEYILLINAERESATAYIDQTVFRGSDGQDVAATSDRVVNNVRKLAGGFGCTNPESIVSYLGQAYWFSSNKGAVCRYNTSNGAFPISEYKARSHFFRESSNVIGGYEPKFKNFMLTREIIGSNLLVNGNFSLPASGGNVVGWFEAISNPGGPVAYSNIISGQFHFDSVSDIQTGDVLTIGSEYVLTFTIVTIVDSVTVLQSDFTELEVFTTTGIKTLTFVATGTLINFFTTTGSVIDNVSIKAIIDETIAFQEGSNRWISKYSFIPERYGHVSNEMFSFKDGVLWKHNASNTYNNFYGVQYTSQVNPVFNKEPFSQKGAMAISLEADKVWTANPITTPEGQETFILSAHFEQINKEWWGDVKQDVNTPNMVSRDEALINGNFMESNVFNVVLESQASDETKLRFVNFYSNINHRTNR